MKKLTPVLIVEEIEPCLSFWIDRLGFERVAEVPEGDRFGFVILTRGGVEIMYQTWTSLEDDVPAMAEGLEGSSIVLFVEVEELDDVETRLDGVERVFDRRTTFYGMDEIGVREPGGHPVIFAARSGEQGE